MNIETLNKKVEKKERYEEIELISFGISFINVIFMITMTIAAIISKNTILAIIAVIFLVLLVISFVLGYINAKEANRETSEIINGGYKEIKMKNSEIEEIKFLKKFHALPDTYLKGPYVNKNLTIIAVWYNYNYERIINMRITSIPIKEAEKIFEL